MTSVREEDVFKVANFPYKWDKLKNATLLISGGTGFIGGFLTDVLRERNRLFGDGIKVISLSRNPLLKDDDTVKYVAADVSKKISVREKADYVIHLASNTHPAQYAKDPVGTITTNIFGCYNLLEFARERSAKRFLLASSVEIYGDCTDTPVNEDYCGTLNCNDARSGYNEAKRLSESLCKSYISQYGTDAVTVRLARCFGADKKKDTKALAQFFDKALSGEDIVLKSDGKQRYSFCYGADAASGIINVLLEGKTGEAYNLSEEDEGKTLGDYAALIASFAGKKVEFYIEKNDFASKAKNALLDTSKIKDLGFKPLYTVSEGMERTYREYSESNK